VTITFCCQIELKEIGVLKVFIRKEGAVEVYLRVRKKGVEAMVEA